MVPAGAAYFPFRNLTAVTVCFLAFLPTPLFAFAIEVGDSRQQVIDTYGYPKSFAKFEEREIFNYSEGSLVLQQGRVAEIRFTQREPRNLRKTPSPQPTQISRPVAVSQTQPAPSRLAPHVNSTRQAHQPQRSPTRMLSPLLSIPAIFVVVTVFAGVLRKRLHRPEREHTSAPPNDRSASRDAKHATSISASPITRLTRDSLGRLEWRRFEELTQGYFEKTGWSAKRSAVGADGGIDIFLKKEGSDKPVACVQCKQRCNEIIGVKFIREFFGVIVSEGIAEGYFVTTSTFSDEAIRFAQGKPLHLITGDDLIKRFAELPSEQHESIVRHAFRGDFETPTCPSCDVKMVLRNGPTPFWGCSNYPRCKSKIFCRKSQ